MNQFNYLPFELIEFIFKKLNLDDLINLRCVDRRFKEISEQIKIKQLLVSNHNNYNKFWFYTNDPIYLKKEYTIKITKFINYATIFHLDKYLRRLSIRSELSSKENFNILILNEFKLLEQLEIIIDTLKNDANLILDNLKIANIDILYNSYFKLTFDTNQLFALKSSITKLSKFTFNNPDKILFYETDYDNYNNDQIQIFNNLKNLKLNQVNGSIDKDILLRFKNLEDLHLNLSRYNRKYDNLKEDIISILDDKENLKRSEFYIYLNGIKLINQFNQLNQLKYPSDNNQFKYNQLDYNQLKFQIKNYDLLKDSNCREKLNYCDLIKLTKIIPSSFRTKFSNIHEIKANDHIDNEDQFIKFLNDLVYLSKLELINCKLSQSFYNKLINLIYLNSLKSLEIEEKENLDLNFDFIFNLKELKQFKTNQQIINYIDLISKLFKENQNIELFNFKFDTENFVEIFNKYYYYKIRSYYLDDDLKKIESSLFIVANIADLMLKLENIF